MSRNLFSFVRIGLCGLFIFSAIITANAQFRAGIQGTISDSSGALVPAAQVTLKDLETGKDAGSNHERRRVLSHLGLAPGKYLLTVEKEGYKKSVSENLTVSAENVQGVDVILEIGEITATVTISDEAVAQLETENANVAKGITHGGS